MKRLQSNAAELIYLSLIFHISLICCEYTFCSIYLFIPYLDFYFVGVFRAEECHCHVWPQPTESRVSVRGHWRHGLWIKSVRAKHSHTRLYRYPGDPHPRPETLGTTGGFGEVIPYSGGAWCQREPSTDGSHCHLCSFPDFLTAAEWGGGQLNASGEPHTQKPHAKKPNLVPISHQGRRGVAPEVVHWRHDLSLLHHHYWREDWKTERDWKDQRWCTLPVHKLVVMY